LMVVVTLIGFVVFLGPDMITSANRVRMDPV